MENTDKDRTTASKHQKIPSKSRESASKLAREVSLKLTEETVRRKSFSDTVQLPSVMLPTAVCLISAGYALLLAPIFGGGIGVMVIGAISGVATVVFFRARYPKVYQKNYRDLTLRFNVVRGQFEEEELNRIRETIRTGFVNTGSVEGLTVLQHLADEYERLKTSLAQRRITDPLLVSAIPVLAGETYRSGLGVLSDTLELMNVVHSPSKAKVQEDIERVNRDIEAIKSDPNQAELLKLKEEMAVSLKERLATINRLNLWIEQLLYQAQKCQAVLHASRIELATARAGSDKGNVNSMIKVLEERIKQVKEVQEEINRIGY